MRPPRLEVTFGSSCRLLELKFEKPVSKALHSSTSSSPESHSAMTKEFDHPCLKNYTHT